MMTKTFLQAEWRKLLMVNYEVDRSTIESLLPYKTELDLWNNTCYISLVGFMFLNTTVRGIKIPFHTDFEEVNLRFYVKHKDHLEWKRGVVFIKEIVPKSSLTFIANKVYNENYVTMPMIHNWEKDESQQFVEYKWRKTNRWNSVKVTTGLESKAVECGSEEEFITEHYWGYTKIKQNQTFEYGVEHPKWEVYVTNGYSVDVDFNDLYGQQFGYLSKLKPKSVFLAEGSEIKVKTPRKI